MPHYSEGIYDAEIVAQGFTESKKKSTPGFYLKIQPENGAYEREITWWLTDNTIANFKRDIRKLGFNGTSFTQLHPESDSLYDLTGQAIQVVCKHEQSADGQKTYERWELPFDGVPREIAPLEKKGVRKLDSLFGKHFKDGGQLASEKPKQAVKQLEADAKAVDEDDEEIPF